MRSILCLFYLVFIPETFEKKNRYRYISSDFLIFFCNMLFLFRIIFPGNIYFIIHFEEQWFLKKHILLFDSEGCFLSKLVCYFIADIDECNKIVNGVISKGGCQHKCNNTIGSYSCSCNDGFVLAYDRRTCLGIRKNFFSLVCFLLRKLFNHREQRKEEIYFIIQTMISIFYENLISLVETFSQEAYLIR